MEAKAKKEGCFQMCQVCLLILARGFGHVIVMVTLMAMKTVDWLHQMDPKAPGLKPQSL